MPASLINTCFQAMSKPNGIKNLNQLSKIMAVSVVVASLFAGCAKEKYIAKPINPQVSSARILAKDPLSADFKAYLIKQGYKAEGIPFKTWGIDELTSSALYHHAKLDITKAQLALANAQLETAGQKLNPILNGSLAHSNQANQDIRPWAYGLNVEIPIETAGKREIRIEEAQHLAEAARLDVAEVAWQLRSQIAKDLLRYHENIALKKQLSHEVKKQDELIKILEKRVQLGALSNTELSFAQLLQQKTHSTLNSEYAKAAEIRAELAADAGLSIEKFNSIILKPLDLDAALAQPTNLINAPKNLQEKALLNRLDIRRSLEKYAVAEARIKLEVAKQTPNISLSPGLAFEFGDSIWSLGFSALINLLNKNQTLIAEATQLREIEGAQFEALQAKIMGDLSQNLAIYQASLQNINQIKTQQATQMDYSQALQKQFDAGLIDRLALTQNSLNTALLEQQLLNAQFNNLNAALAIEDTMQRPVFDDLTF